MKRHVSESRLQPVACTGEFNRQKARSRASELVGLVLLLALLAGCGRMQQVNSTTQDAYGVTLVIEPSPPAVGPGTVIATLKDETGRPVDGARLEIEANMSHAGMVPVLASTAESRAGVYRVPLQWTMAGDWYVDLVFTLPDGSRVVRRYPVGVK
jgi:YtkA-like